MTPLPILFAAVLLGTGNCSSKIVHGQKSPKTTLNLENLENLKFLKNLSSGLIFVKIAQNAGLQNR